MKDMEFKPKQVYNITNINPNKLHYWRRLGLVKPASDSKRQGYSCHFNFLDVVKISLISQLNSSGFSTAMIQRIIRMIDKYSIDELRNLILVTDGNEYMKFFTKDRKIRVECPSVFMIQIYREIEKIEKLINLMEVESC